MDRNLSTHTDQQLAGHGDDGPGGHGGHGGHGLMMIACCIPMLIIAVVLVAVGVNSGFLLSAIACTVMMAAMMWMMSRHGGGPSDR